MQKTPVLHCLAMVLTACIAVLSSASTETQAEASIYSAYEEGQRDKLGGKAHGGGVDLPALKFIKRWDAGTEHELFTYLQKKEVRPHVGSPVLCVGARLGGEVKAFQKMDEVDLAIGVDVNPGEKNSLVMYGDAHDLRQFKPRVFGSAYSNVLDHILHIDAFANATHRLLKPNGTLLIDMPEQPLCKDAWAVHDLVRERGLLECQIAMAGFELVWHTRSAIWYRHTRVGFRRRYIFRRLASTPTSPQPPPWQTDLRVGKTFCAEWRPVPENVSCLVSTIGDLAARQQKCRVPQVDACRVGR